MQSFLFLATLALFGLTGSSYRHYVTASPTVAMPSSSEDANSRRLRVIPGTGLFTEGEHTYLFHGVNLVYKGVEPPRVSQSLLDFLLQSGFNVVRLGFLWYNVQPNPGYFNTTYLQIIRDDIDLLWAHGIRVVLDLHQDCYSSYYCGGSDGVPDFIGHPPNTTEFQQGGPSAFPQPMMKPTYNTTEATYEDPWGRINNCNALRQGILGWATCYATYAMGMSTQRLYDNEDGLLDRFAEFWAFIAGYFKGHSGIIGYELLNEPWLGNVPLRLSEFNIVKNPRFWNLWSEGVADKKNLQQMYNVLQKAIREVDPQAVIFFEPATGGNLLDALPVGFDSGPGGHNYDINGLNVMSYHVYCPLIESDMPGGNATITPVKRWIQEQVSKICYPMNQLQYYIRNKDMQRLQVGGFLTEFGELPKDDRSYPFLEFTLKKMDEYLQSWMYWGDMHETDKMYDVYGIAYLVRPYPMRTWGIPTSLSFDKNTHVMNFQFKTPWRATGDMETSIFLPPSNIGEVKHWSVDVTPYNLFEGSYDEKTFIYTLKPIDTTSTLDIMVQVTALPGIVPPHHAPSFQDAL